MRTSVTGPNIAKYSRNFSELVCQERPPTNSLLGEGEVLPALVTVAAVPLVVAFVGVDRPDEGDVTVQHLIH